MSYWAVSHLEPCQASAMEPLCEGSHGFSRLNISKGSPITDFWLDSKCTPQKVPIVQGNCYPATYTIESYCPAILHDSKLLSCKLHNRKLLPCKLYNIVLLSCNLHDSKLQPCILDVKKILSCKLHDRKLLSSKLHDRILLSSKLHDTKFLRLAKCRHITWKVF